MFSKKDDKNAIALTVGTEENKDNDNGNSSDAKKKKKGKKGEDPDEMSDEDKALKEGLELAVNRIKEPVNLFIFISLFYFHYYYYVFIIGCRTWFSKTSN